MPYADSSIIGDSERLAALRALYLLDSPADPAFDRLTQLATNIFNIPVALVSLVDADRQFFKSQIGLPTPWCDMRQTPLSHSFCQHTVAHAEPLIIEDARQHPLVMDNDAITDLGVIAYAGIPLTTSSGHTIGSFCAIDTQPRHWTSHDVNILVALANSVMTEIELRLEVAERQRVEAALRESEARFRLILSSMDEGVMLQDRDGAIQSSNRGAEAMLGLSVDQMMGRTSLDPRWRAVHEDGSPFPGEDHPAMVALRTGVPQMNVMMGVHKPDDSLTWILVNSQPLIQPDETLPYAVLSTLVDITEQKHAQHQAMMLELEKERVKLLTQFIEKSSHEFRTPITIIQTSLYILSKSDDPDKRQQKATLIEQQTNRIIRLVDMLQKMSKLDTPHVVERRPVNLNRLVDAVVTQFKTADSKPIHFDIDPCADLPPLMADSTDLKEAIWQIVDNAVHFAPTESTVSIQTVCADGGIKLIVQDSGTGIPAEVLPHIFERFYRFDEAHSTPGFGLGLPIAQTVVEQHGGHIVVESEVEEGTIVTIELPINPDGAVMSVN